MTLTDKIMIGTCALVLGLGLTQRHLSKKQIVEASSSSNAHGATSTINREAKDGISDDMAPVVRRRHEVRRAKTPKQDLSISIAEQKRRIRKEKMKPKTSKKTVLPDNFNVYDAKERMKKLLFSDAACNGTTNTLSDAEKWKIIDSGIIAQ